MHLGFVHYKGMRLHIITVGEPKLAYARAGWDEYLKRLGYYHTVRVTHVADKWAYDSAHLLQTAGTAYKIALVIEGDQLSSPDLAAFLEKRSLDGRETCLLVGGPEGLPAEVIRQADFRWSLSALTFPHDLAMVVLVEALYRASTISAGQPYHK
jgi:23S rRNA (pseudouridine1915-N3)-methyltransferase